MDNRRAMKLAAIGVAGMMLLRAQPPDPAELLETARDKVIARLPPAGYACVATINRSYFRRGTPPMTPKSCDQIVADRKKKTRTKLILDMTDRLRLQVVRTDEGESFLWPGPGSFSRNVEELFRSGHFGTGALGAHLGAIFDAPQVRFRLLGQSGGDLKFGFRVPAEASSYLIKTGAEWRETAYDGSLTIDPASLEIKSLTIDTDQLEAESFMCESSTTMEYPPSGDGVLLPSTVRIHDVNRDTSETEWDATFSDCHEPREKAAESAPDLPRPNLFPPTWAAPMRLKLITPIDTSTAAAGDVVTARLAEDVMGPSSSKTFAPAGATLTGRIMSMEHDLRRLDVSDPKTHDVTAAARYLFLIWVDFDTIEVKGGAFSIRARLTCGQPVDPMHTCPFATMSDQKWDRALYFGRDNPEANIVVPAGYTSTWMTGDPASK